MTDILSVDYWNVSDSPIAGTVCWGHVTGVSESNTRTFVDHWTGTGEISSAENNEQIGFGSNKYMMSEIVNTGSKNIELSINVYASGNSVSLLYRTGSTLLDCANSEWSVYGLPFLSLGYVQIRLQNS